ncbi:MAG: IclR family transcriptional regulator [Pseudonocardia sp.]
MDEPDDDATTCPTTSPTARPTTTDCSGRETNRSVLDRADTILSAFDPAHPDLSLLGIMARTGLPKTTVHRAVHKMVDLDWLQIHDGRYSIGGRMLELTSLSWANTVLRAAALPTLQDLHSCTRETIHLAIGTGSNVVYIEKLPGRSPMSGLTRIGSRLPAYCTGLGKAILAFSPPRPACPLPDDSPARTRHTIVSARTMTDELRRIQDEGIAYDREEYSLGVECVAAPLRRPDGVCAGSISVSVRAHKRQLRTLAPTLRAAAAAVSRAL